MVTFGSESVVRKGVIVGNLAHGSQELAVVACCLNDVDVVIACFLCPRAGVAYAHKVAQQDHVLDVVLAVLPVFQEDARCAGHGEHEGVHRHGVALDGVLRL